MNDINPKIKLSVCIATYNRCQCVEELVKSVLSIQRDDIDVVVTDNASTDGTVEMLQAITDPRLKLCLNKQPVRAWFNIIDSIFNGDGKYVLYSNDRDMLFPEQVEQLIELLYKDDYSFIGLEQRRSKNSFWESRKVNTQQLYVYKKGAESLMVHKFDHHPTGMVFNRELMAQHLRSEDYYQYEKQCYLWDFLLRDLVQYEKSAKYDNGAWHECSYEFLRTHHAGTYTKREKDIAEPLWFQPRFFMRNTTVILQSISSYPLSESEQEDLVMRVLAYHIRRLIIYKSVMADPYQTTHYSIKMRFVTTLEMLYQYNVFWKADFAYLQEKQYPSSVIDRWKRYRLRGGG